MAHREDVMLKQGFSSLHEYYQFARDVGKQIDFNRRMKKLARYYQVSIHHLDTAIEKHLYEANDPHDPLQLIRDYLLLLENDFEDLTIPGILAEHIRPTTRKSFFRYGDRNTLTTMISRHYINDADGTPLDTQAQNLSTSYEREITTDDLIEFMLSYENPNTYQSEVEKEIEALEIAFKATTGFTLNADFALRFHQEFISKNIENSVEKAPF